MSETRDTPHRGFNPMAMGRTDEHREIETLDPISLQLRTTRTRQSVLVEPFGYLVRVLGLMLETIEIAAWGTLIAIVSAIPLAYFGARNYSPHASILFIARGLSSFLRAVPELISALLLVLVFGFGPIAGVLALGLHAAGFLGKFFADGIENAAPAPQYALRRRRNKTKILRHAVLPGSARLPGYVQYVRAEHPYATVIGIRRRHRSGVEGRFEMFDFVTSYDLAVISSPSSHSNTTGVRARLV
jgi:phosphonate transport system permease protein